jgi:hypothetical protein
MTEETWFGYLTRKYDEEKDYIEPNLTAYRICASYTIDTFGMYSPEFEQVRKFGEVQGTKFRIRKGDKEGDEEFGTDS